MKKVSRLGNFQYCIKIDKTEYPFAVPNSEQWVHGSAKLCALKDMSTKAEKIFHSKP